MKSLQERPVLALTAGDVAGIGPELVVMALSEPSTWEICRPLVVGPLDVLRRTASALGRSLSFREVRSPDEAIFEAGTVEVIQPNSADAAAGIVVGQVDPRAGEIAAQCLARAFELAAAQSIQGVVGAPLNKQAFRLAGYDFLDEVGYLTKLTASDEPRLFGVLGPLWTTCTVLHVAFKDIAGMITKESVLKAIQAMNNALTRAGIPQPSITVGALNPHNGEGGLMGREEIDEIAPAVDQARHAGIDASGPYPADTLFPRAFADHAHGVVCMYHDQANIARKLGGFTESASAFLGLPVPYATTAHGTAFDLVLQGKADPSSYMTALRFVVGQCSQ